MVFRICLLLRDACGHAHHFVASFIDRTPRPRANARQNRGAISRAFFGCNNFHFVRVDVRLNLPPQRRTRAAAAQPDRRHGNFHLLENRECIFQAVGDAFHDGPNDVPARVGRGQSNQGGAGIRIEMRSALAHQIGHPECALRTRPAPQLASSARMSYGSRPSFATKRSEAVPKPSQRQSRGLRHAHHVPASWDGVAESVQPTLRIQSRTIRRGKDDAGSSNRGADRTSPRNTHARLRPPPDRPLRRHRSSHSQSGGLRSRCGNLSANLQEIRAAPEARPNINARSCSGLRSTSGGS